MNTFEFLAENFAKHMTDEKINDPVALTRRALSKSYDLDRPPNEKTGKVPTSRLKNWVVVYNGGTMLKLDLAVQGVRREENMTWAQAFVYALENLPAPWCFLQFENTIMSLSNVFLTHDIRAVRICSPKGVVTLNWLSDPTTNIHRTMLKEKSDAA